MTWMEQAACAGADPDLFFPHVTRGENHNQHKLAEAAAFCRVCPVRAECYQYAYDDRLTGVWGGWLLDNWGRRRRRNLLVDA